MWIDHHKPILAHPMFRIGALGVIIGIVAGLLSGVQPIYLSVLFVLIVGLLYFFTNFEKAVLGLLILRSSLDIFLLNSFLLHWLLALMV